MRLDVRCSYFEALGYFGRVVSSIQDLHWSPQTPGESSVLEIVARIAREQYRVALVSQGKRADDVEKSLPGDPLGLHPIDGWDLAAEQAQLAVPGRDGDGDPIAEQPLAPEMDQLLRQLTVDLVRSGRQLAKAIEHEVPIDAWLLRLGE